MARSKADEKMEVVPPESPSSGSSQETDRDGGEEADSLTRQPETGDVGEGLSQRHSNENDNESATLEQQRVVTENAWEEKSNAKGFTYYVNRVTGDTVWEKPKSSVPPENKNTVWDEWAKNGINETEPTWEKYFDEQSGHEYYHNPLTMENSWTLPAGAKCVVGMANNDTSASPLGPQHTQQKMTQNSQSYPGYNRYNDDGKKTKKIYSNSRKATKTDKKHVQLCYDKDGTPYYYNTLTGESNWVLEDLDIRGKAHDDEYSDESISSYEEEVEETFDSMGEEEDILDRLKLGALQLSSHASDYVSTMKPHAIKLGHQAYEVSKRGGAVVVGATVTGVSNMWTWIKHVTSQENMEWVQKGSKEIVGNIQEWVDQVVIDPNVGIERLVETTSKRGEEGVEWMLGSGSEDSGSSDSDEEDEGDVENNLNDENCEGSTLAKSKTKKYKRISFDPSKLSREELPSSSPQDVVPVEEVAEKVALEHGNYQSKKLESTLDKLSANILKESAPPSSSENAV